MVYLLAGLLYIHSHGSLLLWCHRRGHLMLRFSCVNGSTVTKLCVLKVVLEVLSAVSCCLLVMAVDNERIYL
jgi:hypothetical protein